MLQPPDFRPAGDHPEVLRSTQEREVRYGPAPDSYEHSERVIQDAAGFEEHEHVLRDPTGAEHQERYVHDLAAERTRRLYKASQTIWLVLGILEWLIGLRVFLRLIGANPDSGFATFIYGITAPFVAPFFGVVGNPSGGGMVLELTSLIAMLIYALIAWAIVRIIWLIFSQTEARIFQTYHRRRS